MAERDCGQFDAVGAEVALGVADSWERSVAMDHVEHCARCRQELVRMSDAADRLLDLAPPVDPPPGFESRVLASLAAVRAGEPEIPAEVGPPPAEVVARRPPGRAARGHHRLLPVAAAAIAGLGVAAGAWALGFGTSGSPGHPSGTVAPTAVPAGGHVVRASLMAGGRAVGDVVLRTGRDPWISMAVRQAPGGLDGGTVTCRLRTLGGGTAVVGSFTLTGGSGYWAAPVPTTRPVRAAQLVDAAGRVVASAVLSTTGSASHP